MVCYSAQVLSSRCCMTRCHTIHLRLRVLQGNPQQALPFCQVSLSLCLRLTEWSVHALQILACMLVSTSSPPMRMGSSWAALRLARCLMGSSRCLQAMSPRPRLLPQHSRQLLLAVVLSRSGQQQADACWRERSDWRDWLSTVRWCSTQLSWQLY